MVTKDTASNAVWYGAGGVIGGAIGYALGMYNVAVAKANVKIRPELANVDGWTAALTDHFGDWLVYNYPGQTTTAVAIVGAIAGLTLASKLNR